MTSERYNARESEPRWQRQWDEKAIFASKNDDPRPKYYVLEMFPYPSGRIHIGHVRNYTLGDVLARFMRAKGFNVLHPMGWDAFGLPAENAAIERKVAPKAWTYDNIAAMKKQLRSIGLSLDWSREFATCDPSYYKHQQKLFLDFLRAGLAEREKRKINWDPVDMTVLADEQVIDGRGWRSGAVVAPSACWVSSLSTPPPRPTARPSSRSSPPGRTRCSAPNSWRSRPIIRWRRPLPSKIRSSRNSSPRPSATVPRRRSSTPRKSSASTPASRRSTRLTRTGSCRSTSPTSC